MQHEITIDIDASAARVFHCLEDPKSLMKWLTTLVENERLEGTGSVGSTFRQVYLERGRRMEMFGKVTVYEPGRRLACEIRGPTFDVSVDYLLEDRGGRTRLTQRSATRFRGWLMRAIGALTSPLVKKAAAKQGDDAFALLKRLAEAPDG